MRGYNNNRGGAGGADGGGLARYTVAYDCSSLDKTNTMPNNACDHKV